MIIHTSSERKSAVSSSPSSLSKQSSSPGVEVARAWCGSRRRLALTIFLAIGLPLLAACGKDSPTAPEPPAPPPPPPPTPVPTRIEVTPSSVSLNAIGQTLQLTAQVFDQNNAVMSGATVVWSSSALSVATVNGQGLVTAVGNGSATVTARSGSASASVPVTMMQSAGSIVIEPSSATLMSLGETVQLSASVLDGNGQPVAGAEVTWSSSDEAVATVSAQGLVTAVGNGSATIAARSGSASASIPVSVMQSAGSIVIEPSMAALMSLGETVQLSASVLDGNGQPVAVATVEWSSSDASVATVSSQGLVTAVGNGSATVMARSGSASASVPVSVMQSVGSIAVEPSSATLMSLGETVQLSASVLDGNGQPVAGAEVTWSSSDASVATVSSQGLVTAVGNGSVTVMARSGSASTSIPVTMMQSVDSIAVEPSSATLMSLGETVQLSASVLDGNGQTVEGAAVEWSSSDASVATVSGQGLVTAVGNGSATVTARSGSASASVPVTVMQSVSRITIEPTTATLTALGETVQLSTTVLDLNGQPVSGATVEWSSSDASVATVSAQGLVTAVANGSTQITAHSGSASASVPVSVMQSASSIVIEPPSATLTALGETLQLSASVLDANDHTVPGAAVEWSSSDASVATVSAQGLVTAVANGSAQITARLGSMSESAVVNVVDTRREREVLNALYHSTDGPNWVFSTNWLSDKPLYEWYGVRTDSFGRVTYLQLYTLDGNNSNLVTGGRYTSNGLSGSIPPDLGQLESLVGLYLPANELSGSIPPELGNLSKLRIMHLGFNQLSGSIPPELGNLSNLLNLYLLGNQLSGSLPDELGQLQNLRQLDLKNNELTGSIPPELGQLQKLITLRIGGNRLTGNIPDELGQLQNLLWLDLWVNQLTGAIPPEIGQLRNLDRLELSYNKLTGSIPPELGQLQNLTTLHIHSNRLTGNIPPELGQLTKLTGLSLSNNASTGSIPPELAQLQNLEYLSLSDNQLTGIIPPELGQLQNLRSLNLSGNQLTGCIPMELQDVPNNDFAELGLPFCGPAVPVSAADSLALVSLYNATGGPNWTNNTNWLSDRPLGEWYGVSTGADERVSNLNLRSNQLTGSIPPELRKLVNLTGLFLWDNSLTGSIPSELGQLQNLEYLSLSDNQLTGRIPPELGQLQNLVVLVLFSNELTGSIPLELGQLQNLSTLSLGSNELTGRIPPELGQLHSLTGLHLANNRLTGSIPPELGQLRNLTRLILLANSLTGRIPPELGQLQNLRSLSLHSNSLTGSIPPELGKLHELTELYLAANRLTGSIPSELGQLENLIELYLGQNQLTGCIPTELRDVESNDLADLGLSFCDPE